MNTKIPLPLHDVSSTSTQHSFDSSQHSLLCLCTTNYLFRLHTLILLFLSTFDLFPFVTHSTHFIFILPMNTHNFLLIAVPHTCAHTLNTHVSVIWSSSVLFHSVSVLDSYCLRLFISTVTPMNHVCHHIICHLSDIMMSPTFILHIFRDVISPSPSCH